MTAAALDLPRPWSAWRRHGVALALVWAALLLLFRHDVERLVHLWWTSTTFGHCLFIGPVIAWLVWQRRGELAQLRPAAWWPGLLLVAAGGFAWLLGEAGSVAFARQFGLLFMLEGAVVTLLGPQVARGLLFPLAYAVFLVPFGEGIEGPLQTVTVAEVMPLLHLAGVPASQNGVLIVAGGNWFEVAEACSGAKFVLAMLAFAVLVCNQCFTSSRRRAAFMVVALVVPVIANGLRAFGTIYAAHLTSVEQATGYDHIVYGWLFFAVVMAAVIALAWRWFDRAPDAPAFDPADFQGPVRWPAPLLPAALLVLAVAWTFPKWSDAIAARAQRIPALIELPRLSGWQRTPLSRRAAWLPWYPGADRTLIGRYIDDRGTPVDVAVAVYGSQSEGKEIVAFGTGVLRENDRWVRIEDLPPIDGGSAMRITAPSPDRQPVERVVATWYRVGDVLTSDPRLVKIETARARLLGGPQRAVAIHLSAEVQPGRDPAAAIRRLLGALGPLDRRADHWAGMD